MKHTYKNCASEALVRDDEDGLLEWEYGEKAGPRNKVIYTVSVKHLAYPSVRGFGSAYTPIDASRKARIECLRRMEEVMYKIDAWGGYSYAR
jgi:hypothetical protein